MKKMLFVIMLLLLSFSVLSWGAQREIKGNSITLVVDPADGRNVFTITEELKDVQVVTFPANCGLSGTTLRCNSDDATQRTIVYLTSGAGTVSGKIVGRSVGAAASTLQEITGDTLIGNIPPPGGNPGGNPGQGQSCIDGEVIATQNCACQAPYDDIRGKCTGIMNRIKSQLNDASKNKLQQVSAIAKELRDYFASA